MAKITFDDDFTVAIIDDTEHASIDWFDADDLGFINLVWLKDGRCFVNDGDALNDPEWRQVSQ